MPEPSRQRSARLLGGKTGERGGFGVGSAAGRPGLLAPLARARPPRVHPSPRVMIRRRSSRSSPARHRAAASPAPCRERRTPLARARLPARSPECRGDRRRGGLWEWTDGRMDAARQAGWRCPPDLPPPGLSGSREGGGEEPNCRGPGITRRRRSLRTWRRRWVVSWTGLTVMGGVRHPWDRLFWGVGRVWSRMGGAYGERGGTLRGDRIVGN